MFQDKLVHGRGDFSQVLGVTPLLCLYSEKVNVVRGLIGHKYNLPSKVEPDAENRVVNEHVK